jgi:hypothetical protein
MICQEKRYRLYINFFFCSHLCVCNFSWQLLARNRMKDTFKTISNRAVDIVLKFCCSCLCHREIVHNCVRLFLNNPLCSSFHFSMYLLQFCKKYIESLQRCIFSTNSIQCSKRSYKRFYKTCSKCATLYTIYRNCLMLI